MPLLEYLEACSDPRYSEEYASLLVEFEEFVRSIGKVRMANRIVGPRLSHKILLEGFCSGEWRVYHAAVDPAPDPSSMPIPYPREYFLGVRVGPTNSQVLGDRFDQWVREANDASSAVLAEAVAPEVAYAGLTSPVLGRRYLDRHRKLAAKASEQKTPLGEFKILPKPRLDPFGELLTDVEPDGLLLRDRSEFPGAVFEAKLSEPEMPKLEPTLALYSVFASIVHRRQFLHTIILHSSMENETLETRRQSTIGAALGLVRMNIQKLSKVVSDTHLHRRSNRRPTSATTTWRHFLYAPRPPRPDDFGEACQSCPYASRCWISEGVPRAPAS